MNIHDFIKGYRRGFDVTKGTEVNFDYYEFEKRFINHIDDNRFSITKKSRQMHITTLLANYVAWHMLFGKKQIVIIYMATRGDIAGNFVGKVHKAIRNFNINIVPERQTKREIQLGNGSRLKGVTTTSDALKGFTSDIIIFDEAAFIDGFEKIIGGAFVTLETNGKMILASTTNGVETFHKVYEESVTGKNEFKNLSLNYKDNPRFNNDEWFNSMCRALNMDKRRIQSELLAEFATWRPRLNKSVKLQFRVSEEMLYDMQIQMQKHSINGYSEYIRKLVEDDVNSPKHE